MPKKLASFDFKATARRDWAPLLDGSIWVLNKGEDFDGDPQKFAYQVRSAARRAGRVRREEQDRVADLIEFLLYETESQQVADVLVRLARDVLDAGPAPLTRQPIQ